jgi:hypothetical protein
MWRRSRARRDRRLELCSLGVLLVVAGLLTVAGCVEHGLAATGPQTAPGLAVEVVVTNVGRPIQLAFDGDGRLVILSHGRRGDAAAEILRLDVNAPLPIDADSVPRVVVPFAGGPRKPTFGSLAVEARSGALYLGEENGNRVYRLSADSRLSPVAVGLNHLVGGSSIALDAEGRLIALDYVSPETQARAEVTPPPGLDVLGAGGYHGPVVLRASLGDEASPARRLDLLTPFFPRTLRMPPGEPLTRFIAVAAHPSGDLLLIDSLGEVVRLTPTAQLRRLTRLPAGHYQRTSTDLTPDGALLVSTGFHVRRLYRVSPAGVITTLASELGDPNGVAVDAESRIYIAETALHRVIRLVPARS